MNANGNTRDIANVKKNIDDTMTDLIELVEVVCDFYNEKTKLYEEEICELKKELSLYKDKYGEIYIPEDDLTKNDANMDIISDELADFLGLEHESKIERPMLISLIDNYIKTHNLRVGYDNNINHDEKLYDLLGITQDDKLTYFNLNEYVAKHCNKNNMKSTIATENTSDKLETNNTPINEN